MRMDWGILVRADYPYVSVRVEHSYSYDYRGLISTVRELLSQPLILVYCITNLYLNTINCEEISFFFKINYSGTKELVSVSFF